MTNHRIRTVLLVAVLAFGLFASSKAAYAHNFSSDESASFLAKVQEIQVESHLAQSDLANATNLQWHLQKLNQYWTASDTTQMAERNQLLSKQIPAAIVNITTNAMAHNANPTQIAQQVSALAGYLNESVSVRVDQPKLQNLTVSALAIKSVLDEALNDYGNATGATMSLTNMNNMGSMSMSSGSMSSMQMSNTSAIVNAGAFESSLGMVNASQKMWVDLKAKTPSNVSSTAISALDAGFAKLVKLVSAKASAQQVMEVVHSAIHPNLAVAYGLQEQGVQSSGGASMQGNGSMSGMSGGMSGSMTGNNMTMGSNMTMSAGVHVPHMLLAYISETAQQIHSSHGASSSGNSDYKSDTKYTLNASGTATSVSDPSKTADVKVTLDLSTWKAEGRVVTMDVMGGSVTVGQNTVLKVHSGIAAYVLHGRILYAVALITPAENPGLSSVQVLKIRAELPQDSNKLPVSSSDQPLKLTTMGNSMLMPDWSLQLDGQIALS